MFYELGYIIPATVEQEGQDTLKTKINSIIQEEGGNIIIEPPAEKRKLSYMIKRTRQGIFQFIRFSAEPDQVAKIGGAIRLVPELIRHTLVKLLASSPAEVSKTAMAPKIIQPESFHAVSEEVVAAAPILQSAAAGPAEPLPKKETIDKDIHLDEAELDKRIDKILEGKLDV